MLKTENIVSGYDKVMIINNINIDIKNGEIVSIIGRNGVGKSTFMKTIIGLNKIKSGKVIFCGKNVTKVKSYDRASMGMGYVPQGHGIFPGLTVEENLRMGMMINTKDKKYNFDMVYSYFPILAQRKKQLAGTMSGGEQAMLSIGRVLVGNPKILLLDEPSEGVQPNIVQQIGDILKNICKELNLTTLFVEQHMGLIQQISERSYILNKGCIVAQLTREQIENKNEIKKYLTV
ncbi:ABC transporter ATP-binding protein [Clostridium sp. LBM24168]